MSRAESSDLFDAIMTAKIIIEDLIELERAGHPSGFKPGCLQKELSVLNRGLTSITEKVED